MISKMVAKQNQASRIPCGVYPLSSTPEKESCLAAPLEQETQGKGYRNAHLRGVHSKNEQGNTFLLCPTPFVSEPTINMAE